ncbi:MAG TPA: thioredoxin domain-containing protein [Niabella sp.]|nr:thioredoxin domain-containing protein [Niabella sp.]HOZ98047.1 thioredoxin domain-containing protein [Niabella sp.]HQW14808.1 thioredoxin domain-containing protein [Niabella sp.]HQX18567.1 thioredoxin domain-containing protein [Niabella sp.]HQX40787.1 thioredoxin domain-containing protein [Niabella sp.]
MKKILSYLLLSVVAILSGNANSHAQETYFKLDAQSFGDKIKTTPAAVILDVRTPGEFEKGHLKDAVNFNWNDENFSSRVDKMDKSEPVFVYCLSGGRSAAAAKAMREMGFKQVYEMVGGMLKWRAAKLPETADVKAKTEGMTLAQFNTLVQSDKFVLVDFYADWCVPCKKMKPYLDEIAAEKKQIKIIRIDIDAHASLSRALKIESLPVLHFYKNKKLAWQNAGYINKKGIENLLKKSM